MDISESGLFIIGGPRDRPFNPFRALRSDSVKAIAQDVLDLGTVLNVSPHPPAAGSTRES
jgi:hypothetical protein